MKHNCIIAIETSCDDTSVAIAKNNKLLKECTLTSLKEHAHFGGIVPEVAARGHEKSIALCLDKVMKDTKTKYSEITNVAYTDHPGLPGSLHIGKVFAKSVASLTNARLLPINHLYGHIFSFCINTKRKITYPFLSLVVSGGHTSIYMVRSIKNIKLLNATTDDAVGETLDKIGRAIGVSYPGGISIDKLFDPKKTNLKMINHFPAKQQFSFSGIKTHILNYVNQAKMKHQKIDQVLVGSSTLEWMVDELIRKLKYYIDKYDIKTVVIGGGVSANKRLRQKLQELKQEIIFPELKFCGDNSTMILNYANLVLNHCQLYSK